MRVEAFGMPPTVTDVAADRLPADDSAHGSRRLGNGGDPRRCPQVELRREASYRIAGYTLAAGAHNLFDVFPDRNTTVNSFNGIQTLPSQSPFGMNGRAIYARIGRTC